MRLLNGFPFYSLALATAALLCGAAVAQERVDASLLNLNEAELQTRLPELRRASRPVAGPRGLRGVWTLAGERLQGLPLETTLYVKARQVLRIEQRWASSRAQDCAPSWADALETELSARWGDGLTAIDKQNDANWQRNTVWTQGDNEARLLLAGNAGQCTAMLVYEPHITKDAAEL
jgi:hypothetical protein